MNSVRIALLVCAVTALSASAQVVSFSEGWETAQPGVYVPPDFIRADGGLWFLGDTVSEFPECGPTPQQAEIVSLDGGQALILSSNDSNSDCADDVWVALTEFNSFNAGFAIPMAANTVISFEEVGELDNPELHDSGQNCALPPCFDNVSLILSDNNGNILAYVLQRFPGAVANLPNANFGDTYREIFLDPSAGTYSRNLFEDFSTIPAFDPAGARVEYIEFRVDEHGLAILDNLGIGPQGPPGTVPVYRFWSPVLGCHFFTADESERQAVLTNYPDIWLFEGVAWHALPDDSNPDAQPVYRFWSPVLSSHFYTIDEAERDKLIDQFSGIWTFEGIAFHAFPEGSQPVDTGPVYRFFSPVLGCHFFTINEAERDKLLTDFPDIWTPEGIAWYAYVP